MSDTQRSVELVNEIAKDALSDAVEILQLIELMRRQNTDGINRNLSDKAGANVVNAVRNSFVARITTLVERCYSKVTRDDDRQLRRAFELLGSTDVRERIEQKISKEAVAEAEQLWKKMEEGDSLTRVRHLRHKFTAHWAKPDPAIPLPSYSEFFEFAVATTQVIEKFARAVGGKGDTLDKMREGYVVAAQTFWKPWEAPSSTSSLDRTQPATLFRVVRYTNNQDGKLAERAVLSGRLETRGASVAYIEAEGAKNAPWGFDKDNGHWWITDKNGRVHWLLIEG
jgi:hypothetical protein